jgi:hypothetical protein
LGEGHCSHSLAPFVEYGNDGNDVPEKDQIGNPSKNIMRLPSAWE